MIKLSKMTDAEVNALREHQRKIADRDKNKRRRAVKNYLVFIDYLERIGRITPEERNELEYYRMEDRHI